MGEVEGQHTVIKGGGRGCLGAVMGPGGRDDCADAVACAAFSVSREGAEEEGRAGCTSGVFSEFAAEPVQACLSF